MTSKKKGQTDTSKFEGNGISFKAKLIGTEEVAEARGDLLCQDTITKLKSVVKSQGQHKQKIYINVTLEGLKIIDAVSLTNNQNKKKSDTRNSKTSVDSEEVDKTDDMLILHTHPVHRISFISRDTTDNRAFGYIFGSVDGKHTFFAIKTAAASEQLVLTLRDLFQVVYELKKKEGEEAKEKLEESKVAIEEAAENGKPSGQESTSEGAQTQTQTQAADTEDIYRVPPNNAPVNRSLEEQQANLLDLEDQADTILKGIEQIKNLEFDSITNDGNNYMSSPVPMSPPPVQSPGTADPWATTPAAPVANSATSNLGDLAGIQTGPFVNMPQQQQAFPGGPFPGQMAGYNVSAVPGFNMPNAGMPNAGLPVSRDPFGSDPFTANYQQGMRPAGFVAAPGFGVVPNPFGGAPFGQQYPGQVRPQMPGMNPAAGMFPARPVVPAGVHQNPFAANPVVQEDPNLLKPIRNEQQGQEAMQDQNRAKSPKADLFGDLLGITKSTTAAKTPKDMFAQLSAVDKKSMNQLKNPLEASFDPFIDEGNVSEDKRRGLIPSEGEDPFDTSHISSLPTVPHVPTSIPPSLIAGAPPIPQRLAKDSLPDKSSHKSSSPSSSSPRPTSKQPSLLSPPPPPNRVKSNPSSTLPSLLSLSDKGTDHIQSFILPSPDEPPPPLPQEFIKSPAAPPPPPRPSSSRSLSSVSSGVQHPVDNNSSLVTTNQSQSSSHTLNSPSLSSSSSFSDLEIKQNTPPSKPKNSPKNMLKFDLTFSDETANDPFSIPLKSSSHNDLNRNRHNNNNDNNNINNNVHTDKSRHVNKNPDANHTPESRKRNSSKHTDSFHSNSPYSVISNSTPKTGNSSEGAEMDPFGLPLHLTPGFKAVARFGSDPFEDSFGASTTNTEEDLAKWDPFPDTPSPFESFTPSSKLSSNDPWNTNASAFGDAFANQPTNNNNG